MWRFYCHFWLIQSILAELQFIKRFFFQKYLLTSYFSMCVYIINLQYFKWLHNGNIIQIWKQLRNNWGDMSRHVPVNIMFGWNVFSCLVILWVKCDLDMLWDSPRGVERFEDRMWNNTAGNSVRYTHTVTDCSHEAVRRVVWHL